MKKRILSVFLALLMLVGMMSTMSLSALAADNPYPTWQTVGGVGTIPCTRYAWQQAYDRLGIALPSWGNAINWYYSAPNSGFSVGTTPCANSIAVWTIDSHSYGHVAFVTAVNGDRMIVNEGGRTDAAGSSGIVNGQDLPATVGSTWYGRTLVGFVYLDGYTENPITYTEIPRDVYYIRNVSNNECLSVSGGIDAQGSDVVVWEYNEHPASQIEIIPASSGYKLRSGCSATRVVNAYGDYVAAGQRVTLWDDVNDGTQWWGFEKVSGNTYIIRNMQNQNCVLAVSGDGRYVVVETYTGNNNQLWTLTPKQCKHSVYYGTTTTPATCTSPGVMTHTCGSCGHSYTESIPRKEHSYNNIRYSYANCTSGGYTTYSCSCGASYTADHTSALGHSYTNACDASCNRCGATRSITHNYASATCTAPKKCTICGTTSGTALGHTYTNNSDATCNRCTATRPVEQPTSPTEKPTTTPTARPTTPTARPTVPTPNSTHPTAAQPTEKATVPPTVPAQSMPVATVPTGNTAVEPTAPAESTPAAPTEPTQLASSDPTVSETAAPTVAVDTDPTEHPTESASSSADNNREEDSDSTVMIVIIIVIGVLLATGTTIFLIRKKKTDK